jgi:G6PDH family F420-dependent oxidoreductase
VKYGYSLICEEHSAQNLIADAARAVDAGIDYLSVSDHFHPWLDEQGESPFAWTVLGALAAAHDVPLMTAVTCPFERYHPLVVAQAAATVGTMAAGGFTLGLGSGEALNEHITAAAWPNPRLRLERLDEAVEIIGQAFEGDEFSYDGDYNDVDRARLYSLPDRPVPLAIAAGGTEAAELAGRVGAALIAVDPDPDLLAAYHEAGGTGLTYGQTTTCWAPSADEAAKLFATQWRQAVLDWTAMGDIPTPTGFAQATTLASPDTFRDGLPMGPDLDGLEDTVAEWEDAGFDHLAFHNVGPHQREFIETLQSTLLA